MEQGQLYLSGKPWISQVKRAIGLWPRLRGLLGCRSLGADAGLLIERCNAVHTLGMKFSLDLVFMDRGWRVTRVVYNVPSGRLWVFGGWRASRVLECEAGCVDVASLRTGDKVEWRRE